MIEFALTGQSEYQILSSKFADVEVIRDEVSGRMLLAEVREFLWNNFGIRVNSPVVLNLVRPGQIEYPLFQASGSLGKYRMYHLGEERAHLIFVVSGLKKLRFSGIVAHEYTHAFEREKGLLQHDWILREGLARWAEYKIMLESGAAKEAEKVLKIKHWMYGRGIRRILELEKVMGARQMLEYLERI